MRFDRKRRSSMFNEYVSHVTDALDQVEHTLRLSKCDILLARNFLNAEFLFFGNLIRSSEHE